ncbi:hypothetical protein BM477_04975 [Boudabousia marimammalium]|uniref:Soluble ligand binding domain-containing protein n=1 Tax=Boudabousia marimammalium TaxID=156892 RepID=A0A1Q5PPL6_9ACTO|nr:hypothetical protein BM477_04975 [Boudabousia marimammalium]
MVTVFILGLIAVFKVSQVGGSFWPQAVESAVVEGSYQLQTEGSGVQPGVLEQSSLEPATVEIIQIEVYVSGAVNQPGVYQLPESARVHQAIAAAGGLSAQADGNAVNLAAKLSDEAHLHVPAQGESNPPVSSGVSGPGDGLGNGLGNAAGEVVRLNSATAAQLQTLPRIGPVLAQRIVEYREQHGPFREVSDLAKVSGIGASLLSQLEGRVTL